MREELEKQLQVYAPKFLRDLYGDMQKTCMHWGIETGDGWYLPLRELFTCIEAINEGGLLKSVTPGVIICDQVKEKFGELCVYWHFEGDKTPGGLNETVEKLIDTFEKVCSCTCELCGGLFIPKHTRRYGTLCPDCEELRKKYGVWDKKIPKEAEEKKDPEKSP